MEKIAQGAEAIIYKTKSDVIKDRIKKGYRLPEIDNSLRTKRTKHEAELLNRAARAGVNVPSVLKIEKTKIHLAFINGVKVRDFLNKSNCEEVCEAIGSDVAKLHSANVVHGDLTTSNIIWNEKPYFIDFGLSQFSEKIEDKAVDIHLFKECLKASHFDIYRQCWDAFKEGYGNEDVLKQLEKVEARGRYKGKA